MPTHPILTICSVSICIAKGMARPIAMRKGTFNLVSGKYVRIDYDPDTHYQTTHTALVTLNEERVL